jgi:hypothetical protein
MAAEANGTTAERTYECYHLHDFPAIGYSLFAIILLMKVLLVQCIRYLYHSIHNINRHLTLFTTSTAKDGRSQPTMTPLPSYFMVLNIPPVDDDLYHREVSCYKLA